MEALRHNDMQALGAHLMCVTVPVYLVDIPIGRRKNFLQEKQYVKGRSRKGEEVNDADEHARIVELQACYNKSNS